MLKPINNVPISVSLASCTHILIYKIFNLLQKRTFLSPNLDRRILFTKQRHFSYKLLLSVPVVCILWTMWATIEWNIRRHYIPAKESETRESGSFWKRIAPKGIDLVEGHFIISIYTLSFFSLLLFCWKGMEIKWPRNLFRLECGQTHIWWWMRGFISRSCLFNWNHDDFFLRVEKSIDQISRVSFVIAWIFLIICEEWSF